MALLKSDLQMDLIYYSYQINLTSLDIVIHVDILFIGARIYVFNFQITFNSFALKVVDE